jgi:hypothetical protein
VAAESPRGQFQPNFGKPIRPEGRIRDRDMTAWLLYLTFLLTPLVLLIITMAG